MSIDMQTTFNLRKGPYLRERKQAFVFLNGGYSRFFVTGNAANYGGGLIWRYTRTNPDFADIRFEYREYYLAGSGRRPEFRISLEFGAAGVFTFGD